jgi:signal transduction histidine kinase
MTTKFPSSNSINSSNTFLMDDVWSVLSCADCTGGAVYVWAQDGLVFKASRGRDPVWSNPPQLLNNLVELPQVLPGQSYEIPAGVEQDMSGYVGYHLYALRFRGKLFGALITDGVLSESDATCVTSLLAAHLYADTCDDELVRLKDEHDEYLNRAEILAATGMLSAGVAHELNNPLNVVLGLSRMLESNMACSEEVRQDAAVIVSEASRAVRVVKQLLSYGRGGGVGVEPVEVTEVAESAASAFEASELHGSLSIERNFTSQQTLVLADSFRLHRAIMELLENSYQAIVQAGVDTPYIGIDVRVDDDYLSLSISDNGAGISPSVLPRVFEPFFTTRETGTGTGMGLALVHKTICEIKGKVQCENLASGGVRVTLSIPSYTAS